MLLRYTVMYISFYYAINAIHGRKTNDLKNVKGTGHFLPGHYPFSGHFVLTQCNA